MVPLSFKCCLFSLNHKQIQTKMKKERLPSVATSTEWRNYHGQWEIKEGRKEIREKEKKELKLTKEPKFEEE